MANIRTLSAAVAGAILLGGTGSALAARDSDMTHQYEAWLNSDVTTDEAVQIAEQATGGEMISVTLDNNDWGPDVYQVEIRSLSGISEVDVDANSGEVVEISSIGPGPTQERPTDPHDAQTYSPSPSDNP